MQIPSIVLPNLILFKVVLNWLCCFSKHEIDIFDHIWNSFVFISKNEREKKGGERNKIKNFEKTIFLQNSPRWIVNEIIMKNEIITTQYHRHNTIKIKGNRFKLLVYIIRLPDNLKKEGLMSSKAITEIKAAWNWIKIFNWFLSRDS